jgi:rSAM/selenodomain-associated transferase 1
MDTAIDQLSLILFAKLPKSGEVKTRLGGTVGMEEAADIYRRIAAHALSLGQELAARGVQVWVFYDPSASEADVRAWVGSSFALAQQHGPTLGERMRNAFDHSFRHGAMRSVLVGTDVPDLSVPILQSAFEALWTHDVVLGPAVDGGYYLIGLNAPVREIFEKIPWSTPSVFAESVRRLKALGLSWSLLPTLLDIDTLEDHKVYLEKQHELKRTPNAE